MRGNPELLNGEPMDDVEVLRAELTQLAEMFATENGKLRLALAQAERERDEVRTKLRVIYAAFDPCYAPGGLMESREINPEWVKGRGAQLDELLDLFNRLVNAEGQGEGAVGRVPEDITPDKINDWIISTVTATKEKISARDARIAEIEEVLALLKSDLGFLGRDGPRMGNNL
jgi:hypothetical protein